MGIANLHLIYQRITAKELSTFSAILHRENYVSDSFQIEWDMIIQYNGIPFGSKSKGKLWPRSYPIQFERKWKHSFLSVLGTQGNPDFEFLSTRNCFVEKNVVNVTFGPHGTDWKSEALPQEGFLHTDEGFVGSTYKTFYCVYI